jgi:hypothetical protein
MWGGDREWRDLRAQSRAEHRSRKYGVGTENRCRGTLRWQPPVKYGCRPFDPVISAELHIADQGTSSRPPIRDHRVWDEPQKLVKYPAKVGNEVRCVQNRGIVIEHPLERHGCLFGDRVWGMRPRREYSLGKRQWWNDLELLEETLHNPPDQQECSAPEPRKTVIVLDQGTWASRYRSLTISVYRNRPAKRITFPPTADPAQDVDIAKYVNRLTATRTTAANGKTTKEENRLFRRRRCRDAGTGSRKHVQTATEKKRLEQKKYPGGWYWRERRPKDEEYPADRDVLVLTVRRHLTPKEFPRHRSSFAHYQLLHTTNRHKSYPHRRKHNYTHYRPFHRHSSKLVYPNLVASLNGFF